MSIIVEMSDNLAAELARCAARLGQTPEAFAAEAVRRLLAVERFRQRRERLADYGPRAGLNTDEDVFAAVS
jgi:predicted transcriptional regulator